MEEKKNKKSKIIKGVVLLGVFLLVFGVSYALFSVVLNGTKRNKITTANFGLSLTDINGFEEEEGYGINLENALPITDEEGLKTEAYQFVVTNTGNIPASYKLKLVDDKENTLNDQYIKYNLVEENYLKTKENTHYRGGLYNTEPKLLNTLNNRVLDEITILPGEKIEYTLNLWLDYDADNNAMNKEFSGKIMVDGTQAIAYTKGKDKNNINYTLYKDGTLIVTGSGILENTLDTLPEVINEEFLSSNLATGVVYPKIKNTLKKVDSNMCNEFNAEIAGYCDFAIASWLSGIVYDKTSYIDRVNSCINTKTDEEAEEKCRIYGGPSDELYDYIEDWALVREFLTDIIDSPILKNVIVDEGITSLKGVPYTIPIYMLTIPSTIENLEEVELDGYDLGYTVIIPPKVEKILGNFIYNTNIKTITIPSNVKTIESHAFMYPRKLESVFIENGLDTIKENAFFIGHHDISIYIPNSVKTVENNAIASSNNVKVYIEIDNTKEFVEKNWADNWQTNATVKYLR